MKEIPTDGGVAHEGLLVLQHGIDGDLLAVLRGDDGNRRLLVGRDRRHLLHHLDFRVLVVDSRERVELHRFDEAARLQRDDDFEDFFLRPAVVSVRVKSKLGIAQKRGIVEIFTSRDHRA